MRAVNAMLTGALVLSILAGSTGAIDAQTLRRSKGPAEVPPSSYKGATYVDSKGCVFLRAGFDGAVQWVPRVTRSRRLICGQKPTLVAGTSKPVKTQSVAAPVQVATVQPQAATTPKRKRINWNWFGQKRQTPTTQPQVQTQVAAVTPKPTTQVAVRTAPNVPRKTRNIFIRTTPQEVHPADYYNGRLGSAGAQSVQVARAQPPAVPKGYKSLLTTDTAPARRGFGTAQGQAQMDLIWTQTTPRKLIDVTTGRDVTAQLPQIKYPYTSTVSTRTYAATNPVTNTVTVPTPRRKKRPEDEASPINMKKIEDVSALDPSVTATPVLKIASSTPATHQFVQVATFGVPANASRTIQRFSASGLPAVSRSLKRSGKTYAIVMLGPFADDAALKSALVSARNAGFSDAFYVK